MSKVTPPSDPSMENGKETSAGMRSRVLVVEDDPSVVRMLRFSLRSAGFEVAAVATGGDALKALEQKGAEAVVLDLGLPDGRGPDVLMALRDHNRTGPGRPVWVVITAQDRDEVAKKFGPLGEHFLPKPFDPWDLVRLLQKLMAKG